MNTAQDRALIAVGAKQGWFDSEFHRMSHELRTPLNHINGFAELLLLDESLSPVHANYVRAILSGSETLNRAVTGYLDRLQVSEALACRVMNVVENRRPESVIGPLGQPMTLASLPSPHTKRWIAHRKAELVCAVEGGLLTIEELCERYNITLEEFVSWQRGIDRLGLRGLWVTRSQKHRDYFERMDRY
jgi:signal transduction histidine kinase